MSRTLIEAPLTTRNARARLAAGLYWRALDETVHLGYRRGKRSGSWLVRWRHDAGYRQAPLGAADDTLDADGALTLNFAQASSAARDLVERRRANAEFEASGPVPSVKSVCETYLNAVESRQRASGKPVLRDARSRLKTYVYSDPLADVLLTALTGADLLAWRERVRGRPTSETTLRRIATDLRSALRRAATEFRSKLPDRILDELRAGFAVHASDPPAKSSRANFVLPDADVRRLLEASKTVDGEGRWEGDLYRLVLGLAATGARFSQLARATVGDVQVSRKRIMLPSSGKGRGQKKPSHTAVPLGEDVLEDLRVAIAGRRGHDPLFQRWGYKRGKRIEWLRDSRRAWAPSELTEPFHRIVEVAGLPAGISAYSLRHSSIVRGLRAGLPVRLVAALHDTSTAMIEKHYSAYIVDAMEELAARAVVPLTTSSAQILSIEKKRG